MSDLFIPVLQGTTREQRQSIHAAKLIYQVLSQTKGVETELVDPKNYTFPGDGNDPEGKDPKYTQLTEKADGFLIVVPEYNHSFPGSLKRMLDSELKNYIHKPVAFAGVSSSIFGGVRAIEALTSPVRELGLVATFTDVHFPRVQDLFDEQGELQDQAYIRRIDRCVAELKWMATVLKYGREHIPTPESD